MSLSRPGAVGQSASAPADQPPPGAHPGTGTQVLRSGTSRYGGEWYKPKGFSHCSYLQVLAALHEVFHIINSREEEVKDLKEVMLLLGKPGVSEKLHQVSKIIPTAEQKNMLQSQTAV